MGSNAISAAGYQRSDERGTSPHLEAETAKDFKSCEGSNPPPSATRLFTLSRDALSCARPYHYEVSLAQRHESQPIHQSEEIFGQQRAVVDRHAGRAK